MNLDPQKPSSLELPNASWVFILQVLRSQQAGLFVDNGQEGIIHLINQKLVDANTPKQEAGD